MNNYCLKHGIFKGDFCNACKKYIIKKIKKEYREKISEELRIKIENNWKIY